MEDKVSLIFVGCVFLLFAAIFLFAAVLVYRKNHYFTKNAIKTQAVMVGSRVEDFHTTEEPQVRFRDPFGKEVFATAQPVTFKKPACKNGTMLQVAYTRKIVMGQDFYDLRIQDERYIRKSHISVFVVCVGIGVPLLMVSIVLFVMSFL